jgi:ABC-type branched-subunit amino acid transport system ATPase component
VSAAPVLERSAAMQAQAALSIAGACKSFGGLKALDGFSMSVARGEIVALLGPNGAGKTTLFNVLTGFLEVDAGELAIGGTRLRHWPSPQQALRLGLARTFQDLRLIRGITVLDNVLLSFQQQRGEALFTGLTLTPRAVALQERANRARALEHLQRVGLAHKARDLAGQLSYGQQKLLTLACILAADAPFLLLDEPVAGVNPRLIERILALIRELAAAGKTAIVIEHNMHAVRQVAQRVVFMDTGRKVCEGDPDEVLSDPRVLEAYLQ